jgi:hypothetical protein
MEHEIVTLARFVDDWLDMAVAVATPVDNYVQETFDIWKRGSENVGSVTEVSAIHGK